MIATQRRPSRRRCADVQVVCPHRRTRCFSRSTLRVANRRTVGNLSVRISVCVAEPEEKTPSKRALGTFGEARDPRGMEIALRP